MRYMVKAQPQAAGVPELASRIDAALRKHGAVAVRTVKRLGTQTFRLPEDTQEAFNALFNDLQAIHEGVICYSYKGRPE